MTTKPELDIGSHLVPGLAALALFGVMAAAFLTATIPDPQGFGSDANITASIGYAMFNLDFGQVPGESFLVAFLVIAVTLDVALDGAVFLARRRDGSELIADGGRAVGRALGIGGETADGAASEAETADRTGTADGADSAAVEEAGPEVDD